MRTFAPMLVYLVCTIHAKRVQKERHRPLRVTESQLSHSHEQVGPSSCLTSFATLLRTINQRAAWQFAGVGYGSKPSALRHRVSSPSLVVFGNANDESDLRVTLLAEDTRRKLECFLVDGIEDDGDFYSALQPTDEPVVLITIEDERVIEDAAEVDALFQPAKNACAGKGWNLINSAEVLTVQREAEDSDGEDDDTPDGDVEVLLEFEHNDVEYYVAKLLEPMFFTGRQVGTTTFVVPSEAEMIRVGPVLERKMLLSMESEDEEDEDYDFDAEDIDDEDIDEDDQQEQVWREVVKADRDWKRKKRASRSSE